MVILYGQLMGIPPIILAINHNYSESIVLAQEREKETVFTDKNHKSSLRTIKNLTVPKPKNKQK